MITPTSNRSRLAGLSMAVGGVLLAVAALLGPPNGAGDTAARLTDLAADPGLIIAKSLVLQGAALLLPGVVAIIGRTRGRGAAVVLSGGVVYAAGIVGAFTFMVLSGLEVAIAGTGAVDPTLVAVDDRVSSSPAAVPALVLALLLFHLVGLPRLAFGMARARQIPHWPAAVATVATCCAFFGSGTPGGDRRLDPTRARSRRDREDAVGARPARDPAAVPPRPRAASRASSQAAGTSQGLADRRGSDGPADAATVVNPR